LLRAAILGIYKKGQNVTNRGSF